MGLERGLAQSFQVIALGPTRKQLERYEESSSSVALLRGRSPMTTRTAHYFRSTGAGLVAKLAAIASSFVALWLINRILDKDQFGSYSFTLETIALVSIFATAGLDQSILYRLSKTRPEPGVFQGGSQVAWVLRRVFVVSLGLVLLADLFALFFAPRSDLPGLMGWFFALSLVIPLTSITRVFTSWYQSQGQVDRSLVVPRLTEISLAVMFLIAWLWIPTEGAVALMVVLSALLPVIVWFVLTPRGTLVDPKPMPHGDAGYGFNMLLTFAADQGVRRLDLIMIGILSTAVFAADYAVAVRLVALTTLGNELLGAVLTPRMGQYLEEGNIKELEREYDLVRSLTVAVGLAVAAVYVGFGDFVLGFLGDYEEARPVLLILSAAFIVKMGFGANGRYLNMSRRAGWNLSTTVVLLIVMAGMNLVLIPTYGATGAAIGTLVSFAAVSTIQSLVIWFKDRFPTMHFEAIAILAVTVGTLLASAYSVLGAVPAMLILIALSIISGRGGWPIARRAIASMKGAN